MDTNEINDEFLKHKHLMILILSLSFAIKSGIHIITHKIIDDTERKIETENGTRNVYWNTKWN